MLLRFAEEDAYWGGLGGEGGGERGGIGDLGNIGAAGLFCGFERDAAPAIYSFGGRLREVLFRAAGEDGRDADYAELGGFLDGPLEVIELEDGEEKMDGKRGVGFELFMQREADFCIGDGGNFGSVQEAVGDDVVDLAGLGAEHAGEVCGLIAGEGGVHRTAGGGRPGIGDEAAAHAD